MYIYTVGVRPMGYRKTACFEALVLEPHFDQIQHIITSQQ